MYLLFKQIVIFHCHPLKKGLLQAISWGIYVEFQGCNRFLPWIRTLSMHFVNLSSHISKYPFLIIEAWIQNLESIASLSVGVGLYCIVCPYRWRYNLTYSPVN